MQSTALRAPRRGFRNLIPLRRQGSSGLCPSCSRMQSQAFRYAFHSSASGRKDSTSPKTYYEMFPTAVPAGPPPNGPFKVDLAALKREFLQSQAKAHPDRHPPDMKSRAEALSARINEAYKTLSDPLLRTQYILSLRGIDVADDETAKVEDAELLMAVLETREIIEDAQQEQDLILVKEQNDKNLRECLDDLQEAFEKDDMDVAKREAVRLRYWVNIKQSVDDWEPGKPVVLNH